MEDRWPLLDDSLAALAAEVWAARFSIAMAGVAGLVLAFLALALATPRYAAEMILSPASPLSSAKDPATTPNDNFILFTALYAGPSVAETLLQEQPETVARLGEDRLFPLALSPLKAGAEAKDLSSYLKRTVTTGQIGNTALMRLTYTHPDPAFATKFLTAVHLAADDRIREEARASATARRDYLSEALAKTANAEDRRALAALLMEQEHITMLATMAEPFAARIIEPATPTPRPVWPRKLPTLLIFMALGAGAGFAAHLWWRWSLRHRGG